jgi:hypothetical protein
MMKILGRDRLAASPTRFQVRPHETPSALRKQLSPLLGAGESVVVRSVAIKRGEGNSLRPLPWDEFYRRERAKDKNRQLVALARKRARCKAPRAC